MGLLRLDAVLPAWPLVPDGGRMLDIGTGDGTAVLAAAMAARTANAKNELLTLDCDRSRRAPFEKRARELGLDRSVRFVKADAFRIPRALGGFDAILCFGCMSQLVFARRGRWLAPVERRIWRVAPEAFLMRRCVGLMKHWVSRLRPGGRLAIIDIDRDHPGDDHARAIALHEAEKWPLLSPDAVRKALAHAGLEMGNLKHTPVLLRASRADMERMLGVDRPHDLA